MEIKNPTKEERIAFHKRGLKMVLLASVLGILAGVLSSPYVLSQPFYVPIAGTDASELLAYPSFVINNATVVAPGGPVPLPETSVLLANSSQYLANASALAPGAPVTTHAIAIVFPAGASVAQNRASVLISNASVTLSNSSEIPANASVLLTNGAVVMPGAPGTPGATVLLGNATTMQVNPQAPNHTAYAIVILALLIYVQKYLFPYLGIDSSKFGWKDWIFLSFMTFCFWFITWTILLNAAPPAFGPFF